MIFTLITDANYFPVGLPQSSSQSRGNYPDLRKIGSYALNGGDRRSRQRPLFLESGGVNDCREDMAVVRGCSRRNCRPQSVR